ncbi:class I SAM-dependent methyltransferase [Croceiramulus getboli]|nr:class I SAM-dependent methyltransferase [Flavobacteriaceae bacterium YJPT1-3]
MTWLINFGCGFNMYPFLLPDTLNYLEIDKPEVVDLKQTKIKAWQQQGSLSERKITFVGVDFTQDYQSALERTITNLKKDQPCFILLEGVIFFLNRAQSDDLFAFFHRLQGPGDWLGSASFRDTLKRTTAYKRLMAYTGQQEFKTANKEDFQTFPDSYYKALPNYSLIDHQDYFSLSEHYGNPIQLPSDQILNEHFYVLQRISSMQRK